MFDLKIDDLSGREWVALERLSLSFSFFEPPGKYRVGRKTFEKFLQVGLIEVDVEGIPRRNDLPNCRVSDLGQKARARGAFPKPAKKKRRPKMLPDRLATLDTSIGGRRK
jgi:hypothetical protein